jgi:hypothetical protein
MMTLQIALTLFATAASGQLGVAADPVRMSPEEIAAYNAKLQPDHARYITCFRASEVIVANAPQNDCRTNQEWLRSGLLSGKEGTLISEPDPKGMSRSEIRASNARVVATDPYFIKCVRSEPIGSLVKSNYSCRTNRQWNAVDQAANDEARRVADQMASKFEKTN